MTDDLTLEQLERIVANHESGVQLTGVNFYRQLAGVMRERDIYRAGFRESDKINTDYAKLLHIRGDSMKPIPECVVARRLLDGQP